MFKVGIELNRNLILVKPPIQWLNNHQNILNANQQKSVLAKDKVTENNSIYLTNTQNWSICTRKCQWDDVPTSSCNRNREHPIDTGSRETMDNNSGTMNQDNLSHNLFKSGHNLDQSDIKITRKTIIF